MKKNKQFKEKKLEMDKLKLAMDKFKLKSLDIDAHNRVMDKFKGIDIEGNRLRLVNEKQKNRIYKPTVNPQKLKIEYEKILAAAQDWKSPEELAGATGTTTQMVFLAIRNDSDFKVNSKGKIITKNVYEKKTPFLEKLLDTYTGKIK